MDRTPRNTNSIIEIAENVFLMPAAPIHFHEDTHMKNLFVESGDCLIKDEFTEEQNIVIVKDKGIVVVSGCSHRGICNILKKEKKCTTKIQKKKQHNESKI